MARRDKIVNLDADLISTIIAITGPSGSGKTLFTESVYSRLREADPNFDVAIIEEDSYYHDLAHLPITERAVTNFDHPHSLDHNLLKQHLLDLRNGIEVNVPVYDYSQHTRTGESRSVVPARVILVEGILLLSDETLRQQFDIKLFVDTPLDLCLQRRIVRDMNERGRSLDSINAQFEKTVKPMYREFIEPSKKYADIVVSGGGKDRMAIHSLTEKIMALAIR